MERRGAHGLETIAPPQEVKWASSKACRAKNLQVSVMGRFRPTAIAFAATRRVWESHRPSSKSPGVTDKQFGAMTDPKCDARVNVGGTRGYVGT